MLCIDVYRKMIVASALLATWSAAACKTTGNHSAASSANANREEEFAARLRKRLSTSQIKVLVDDIRATRLSSEGANYVLGAAFHPENSARALQPVIQALLDDRADINAPQTEEVLIGKNAVSTRNHDGEAQSSVCAIMESFAEERDDAAYQVDELRSFLAHGEDAPYEVDQIRASLDCAAHGAFSAAPEFSDTELLETCQSLVQMSLQPTCPKGWDPVVNEYNAQLATYLSGCRRANRQLQSGISEVAQAEFKRRCPEEFRVGSDNSSILCVTTDSPAHIPCPAGLHGAIVDMREGRRHTDAEVRLATERQLPRFITICAASQSENPIENFSPDVAQRVQKLDEKLARAHEKAMDAIEKLRLARGDLNQPCLSFTSLEALL